MMLNMMTWFSICEIRVLVPVQPDLCAQSEPFTITLETVMMRCPMMVLCEQSLMQMGTIQNVCTISCWILELMPRSFPALCWEEEHLQQALLEDCAMLRGLKFQFKQFKTWRLGWKMSLVDQWCWENVWQFQTVSHSPSSALGIFFRKAGPLMVVNKHWHMQLVPTFQWSCKTNPWLFRERFMSCERTLLRTGTLCVQSKLSWSLAYFVERSVGILMTMDVALADTLPKGFKIQLW